MPTVREEVVNENLAQVLEHYLHDVSAETIVYTSGHHKKKLPDVRVSIDGVIAIIEARFGSGHLEEDAQARIRQGLCDIAVALQYPPELKQITNSSKRLATIRKATFKAALFHKSQSDPDSLEKVSLGKPTAAALAQHLVDSVPLSVAASEVTSTVSDFINELEALADSLTQQEQGALPAFKDRVDQLFGISGNSSFSASDYYYMTFFILANTMVFHQYLANVLPNVDHLSFTSKNARKYYIEQWKIIQEIDYLPIFSLPYRLLSALPTDAATNKKLNKIAEIALDIVSKEVTVKHDFMGQIFTHFLAKSKGVRDQYASFYTSNEAGSILASLVASGGFLESKNVEELRILDPFAGSGTLLTNMYHQVVADALLSGSSYDDLALLRKHLVENVIHGWDVLPFAGHICLLSLGLQSKGHIFTDSKIHQVPIGVEATGLVRLGSFEALRKQTLLPSFDFGKDLVELGAAETAEVERGPFDAASVKLGAADTTEVAEVERGPFDVIVMNPPYKRSAGGGIAFGFLSDKERSKYQKEFTKLSDQIGLPGTQRDVTYNPAVLLGMDLLKENGRLAFILPKTFLSGGSSSYVRDRLLSEYRVLFVVCNSDPGTGGKKNSWNWSEDTDLGEIILIAEKSKPDQKSATTFINFRGNQRQ